MGKRQKTLLIAYDINWVLNMSNIKNTGSANALPVSGASCGLKPSKEALEKGFEVDFSNAKALLENEHEHDEKTFEAEEKANKP